MEEREGISAEQDRIAQEMQRIGFAHPQSLLFAWEKARASGI